MIIQLKKKLETNFSKRKREGMWPIDYLSFFFLLRYQRQSSISSEVDTEP